MNIEDKILFDENFMKKHDTQIICLLITFVLGLFSFGYAFLNYTPSHDGMMVVTNDQNWMTALGRFMVRYYISLRGALDAPWLIGMLGLIYIAIAANIIIKMFDFNEKVLTSFVICSLLLLNGTTISLATVYIYIFDVLAMAVFLCVKYDGYRSFIISSLVLSLSMGLYQSYISYAIALYIAVLIVLVMGTPDFNCFWRKGLRYGGNIILGGIIYAVLMRFSCAIYDISASTDSYNSVTNVFGLTFSNIIRLIPGCYKYFASYFLDSNIYGSTIMVIVNVLLIVLGIASYVTVFMRLEKWRVLVILLLGAITPLGLNAVYVLSGGMIHHLMTHSFSIFYLILVLPLMKLDFSEGKIASLLGNQAIISKSILVLFGILSFCIARYSNDVVYYQKLVGIGTETAMTNVVYDIERTEGYVNGETGIVILGNITEAFQARYKLKDDYTWNNHNI